MKIKLNNYYFDSTDSVEEAINNVIINENIYDKIKIDDIVYTEDEYENGIRQFTVELYRTPIAIISLLENVIEDKLVINYQKIHKNED